MSSPLPHAEIMLHPAMRARAAQIDDERRLKFNVVSGVSATKLQIVIASFEDLTSAKNPYLKPVVCEVAEVTADILRVIRDRLALWANGGQVSLSELSTVESDLLRCKEYLERWSNLIGSRQSKL